MANLILHPDYLLYERKDTPLCTSLQVAESFEKEHKNVLRDIQLLNVPNSGEIEYFFRLNFELISYQDSRGRKQPMFLMTKDIRLLFAALSFRNGKMHSQKSSHRT